MTATKRAPHGHRRCRAHRAPNAPRYRPPSQSINKPTRHMRRDFNANEVSAPESVPAGVEWLTPNQAATHMQIPARQLQQWRYLKKGPPYSLAGRAVRYRRADLDAWLTANRTEPEDTGR